MVCGLPFKQLLHFSEANLRPIYTNTQGINYLVLWGVKGVYAFLCPGVWGFLWPCCRKS